MLIALFVSLVVNRIATMALMFTGLSRESARFQARSAFTGVGFTTAEAENIVNHPLRRRIVMVLMLLGNIGIATVIATVMVSLSSTVGAGFHQQFLVFTVLTVGLCGLWLIFSSRWVERRMNMVIAWCLKSFTDLDVRDYVSLLQLEDGFAVTELVVEPKHWIADGVLRDLRLSDEGILILGIRRPSGSYTGIPDADDTLRAGDILVVYGNLESIRALDLRKRGSSGDKQHLQAVELQRGIEAAEQETDVVNHETP